jgi:hypothetical protein
VCHAHKWIDTSYINKCSIQSHRRWRRDREDAERESERESFQEISERGKGEREGDSGERKRERRRSKYSFGRCQCHRPGSSRSD